VYAYLTEPWNSVPADVRLDTCIGYNSLYVVPSVETPNGQGLPDGRRLWSWLILCDDGMTVIADYLWILY
jgi:hypothetical protein